MPPKKKSAKKKVASKKTSKSNDAGAKNKVGSKNSRTKKNSGSLVPLLNKTTINGVGGLEGPIIENRQRLPEGSERSAQLLLQKQFRSDSYRLWVMVILFLFGIPLIIYLVYYWTKSRKS